MTKPRKRRHSSVEHRSTKRRKRSSEIEDQPVYSTRSIPWEEQLKLPPRFHEEPNVWPVLRIAEERSTGKKKEYLVEWEKHPTTGEIFEPIWTAAENVGQALKKEWAKDSASYKSKTRLFQTTSTSSHCSIPQKSATTQLQHIRKINNRGVIPDSSIEDEEPIIDNSVSTRTPTLVGSPDSAESIPSSLEISETQQQLPTSLLVTVPPAPVDKSEWESLRGSQFSHYDTPGNPTSPFSTAFHPDISNPGGYQASPLINESNRVESIDSSSTEPSSKSEQTVKRDRARHIQRILDYQPRPDPVSTATVNQDSLVLTDADYGSQESLHNQPAIASGSRADENHIPLNDHKYLTLHPNLSQVRTRSTSKRASQPWAFQSQLSLASESLSDHDLSGGFKEPSLSGRCARKPTSNPASQEIAPNSSSIYGTPSTKGLLQPSGMAARGTRQSPRLSTVSPHMDAAPPRIAVRTNSYRARSALNPPEHSSPLALSAEFAESPQDSSLLEIPNSSFTNNFLVEPESTNMSSLQPISIAPNAMHIYPAESAMLGPLYQSSVESDHGLNTLPSIVQDSIEEEVISSAEEASLASKASSSQESLRNERPIPQVDGLVMPTYPILGEDEYAILLPAEGKVQAIYSQTVKVKRKAILRFIRRRGSVNHAGTSTNKTIERNEMIELIGRLHDITTHIDLGLPGIPTQYTIPSQQHAAYAEYAGSKFVFLGYLMEFFKRRPETIVIMAKSGATQDLLEEYLYMRNVHVHRSDRTYGSQQPPELASASLRVELLSTKANDIVHLNNTPSLIIAFDASFEALDPQVQSLRAQSTGPLPIIHLLTANSSEHVERCLPPSMPSPIRLRLLVRATYQAHQNLGGSPTIFANAADELDGRPMDLGDISRAVRKSPNRRLEMMATVVANAALSDDFAGNWTLDSIPEVVLDELDDTPSSGSTVSAATGSRSRHRSQTPVSKATESVRNRSQTPTTSRATTPSARKRQLEVDTPGTLAKRPRVTPLSEQVDVQDYDASSIREQELHRMIDSLRIELVNEKRAREAAEEARTAAEKKADEWRSSLASLQHRYEKRTKKSHAEQKANKALLEKVEAEKVRVEKTTTTNSVLRQTIQQHKLDLEAARTDLKSAGGDIAALEVARQDARLATTKASLLEKSLENTKRDFEFLRNQYQDASNRAAELGVQVSSLESRIIVLAKQASDEKHRLKMLNNTEEVRQYLSKIMQLEAEKRSVAVLYKKLEEESKLLKRNRGVQTRGSSAAPGTPGQRSRQGSPNPGPPSGSRASVLRHER